ncbi:MAG: hypothetical protein ACP5F1_02065 [Thermoplasmata archaeon]|nr:DHHA1 domain-containing protein [Thermoplasmata archaeon]
MSNIITHTDSDGVISAYLIRKYIDKSKKIFFSNPSLIKDTIAKSVIGENKLDKLFILDIAGNDHAVHLSSVYDKTIWIDHHLWAPINNYENVEIYIMQEPSAAQVVSNVFGIEDYMIEMANHIDQNNITNKNENNFRDLISAIKFYKGKYFDKILENLVNDLMNKDVEIIINENMEIIENFRIYVESIKKRLENNIVFLKINGKKIAILETEENIPVYKIEESLDPSKWDVLIVKFFRSGREYSYTKLEFRSKKPDVLKIARAFGGGGHLLAAGASINGSISFNDILSAVNLFL